MVSLGSRAQKPKTHQLNSTSDARRTRRRLLGAAVRPDLLRPDPRAGHRCGARSAVGSLVDVGISDAFIATVRDKVTPGTSALFLLSSDAVHDRVSDEFKGSRGRADQHQPLDRAGGQAPRGLRGGAQKSKRVGEAGAPSRPGRAAPSVAAGGGEGDRPASGVSIVLAQAAGFALLAAISPTAAAADGGLPRVRSPRTTAFMYLVGAVLMTVVTAVAALIIIRTTGLDQPRQHDARYGLRLGLGILAAVAAVVVIAAQPPPAARRTPTGRRRRASSPGSSPTRRRAPPSSAACCCSRPRSRSSRRSRSSPPPGPP